MLAAAFVALKAVNVFIWGFWFYFQYCYYADT